MKKSKSFSRLVSALTAFVVCLMILPLVKPDAAKAENRSGNFSTNYSLGNDPAQNMVNIAFAQEGKNGSQLGYNSDWCAWFVADCARLAGQDAIIPEKGRVIDLASAIKGERTSTPQVGDICIFDWNSVSGPYDHVEIVYKVSGSTVYTIGGNAGSTGNYKTNYVKTRNATATGQVQCYIHPYYNGAYTPENDDELGIPYPRPSGNPLLSTGSRGSGVSWLQTALNKANNAGLDVDGQFGSGTKQAVINFQKANGLEADGIAGPATVNKLVEVIKNKLNPPAPSIKIKGKVWMSDNKMGNEVSSFETGKWYYMCYKLYDEYTGKLISETSARLNDYKITETIYNPDGSVFNTCTYDNSDNNWIGIKPSNAGSYKWELKLTITKTNSTTVVGSKEFNVSESKPTLEAPNLRVDVNDEKVTFSWNLVDNATGYDLRIYYSNGTSYADYWDFSSNEHSLTITMPENTEFYAAVCSKNSNYDECWSYGQQVSFKTGIHKHEWGNWTIGKSATCKEAGIEIRNCKKCDENETRSIPAIGHNWSSWSIVKEATCTSEGQEARTCTVCGAKETCSIAKTVHKFTVKVIAPTFTKQGYDLHTCSKCGDFYKDNYTAMKIKGDINSDGEFNISDAVLLQKWILAESNAKLADWKAADLCEDGKLDVFDLCMMKRMLVAKS